MLEDVRLQVLKDTKILCVFATQMAQRFLCFVVLTKPSYFQIISRPVNLPLSEHVRLTHVNVLGSTTGTNPASEWGDGEDTGTKLHQEKRVFNGVLGRGTNENRVASP